ncbi:Beta-lactamase [Labeo rohita]|uniref:Beta-lactamase n=1 Tax=Labeo rohita TaxID=84645 RepID=A0ABQ8LGU7_LABRO|nr:Beta-lactamase [Labeo rohita]
MEYSDHDYCSTAEPAALDLSLDHTEDLRVEIARLHKQIDEITLSSKFCLEQFAVSDDDIRLYTRFATHAHLMAFWRQKKPATGKNVHRLQRICQSTVSRIINTWANFLYTVLGAVGIWLEEETVKAHMPDVFQYYSDTQVILDCTELHCQTPNSLLLQSKVYSTSLHFQRVDWDGLSRCCNLCVISLLHALQSPHNYLPVKRAQLSGPEVRKTQSFARLRVHVERLIRRM